MKFSLSDAELGIIIHCLQNCDFNDGEAKENLILQLEKAVVADLQDRCGNLGPMLFDAWCEEFKIKM